MLMTSGHWSKVKNDAEPIITLATHGYDNRAIILGLTAEALYPHTLRSVPSLNSLSAEQSTPF